MKYQPVAEWKFNGEVVELEKWMWTATYFDGSELRQFDQFGNFHQFNEINIDEVEKFTMINTDDTEKQHTLVVDNRMKLFHFMRRAVFKMGNIPKLTAYVFGYQDVETGVSIYHFILPDDRIIITTNRDFSPFSEVVPE